MTAVDLNRVGSKERERGSGLVFSSVGGAATIMAAVDLLGLASPELHYLAAVVGAAIGYVVFQRSGRSQQ